MSLAGRRILVTGAARGLGETLARHLAEAGADLVLADILEDEGRAVADTLGASEALRLFGSCEASTTLDIVETL